MMRVLTLKQTTRELKPHARVHDVVTIVIITIISMLTLYYFAMSHATLIWSLEKYLVRTTIYRTTNCTHS